MKINNIYVIIRGKCDQGLQSVLKVKEDYNNKFKKIGSLWLMKVANKIMAGIYVKLNKSYTLYHTILGSINTKQGEAESNSAFKLHFYHVYNTMDIYFGENIL